MKTGTLAPELLRKLDAHWRAANYLSVGQIYLYDNPLLKKPLKLAHIKPRLLGHCGTTPGLNFIYVHLNRVIKEHNLNAIYFTGPGHGGPGLVPNAWRKFCAAGLLSRHDRRHAGTGKLGRAVRHGRVGRCFVGVRRGFRMEQANGRDMGRPQKSSSAGFAARPARSVREVFAVLLTVGLFALEMAFPR